MEDVAIAEEEGVAQQLPFAHLGQEQTAAAREGAEGKAVVAGRELEARRLARLSRGEIGEDERIIVARRAAGGAGGERQGGESQGEVAALHV